MNFTENAKHIKLPTTRRLADFLEVPHYYVLPLLGMMEKDELITTTERVGVHTTRKGSTLLVTLMNERYKDETEALLGITIFEELRRRVNQSKALRMTQ